ncbi:MAG: HAD family hydrolase, partial [Angelakisella sp.]
MKDKMRLLTETKLFVLDMDGTFYLGDSIIEGSLEFLETVKNAGKDYVFFTNNSSKTPKVYVDKLGKMGCHVTEKDIITSGDVTIAYLNAHYKDCPVYLVGT